MSFVLIIRPQKPSLCYVLRLPYHHYPDTSRNNQPVILLELQKTLASQARITINRVKQELSRS